MGAPSSQAEIRDLAAILRAYVEHQRELGVLGFPPAAPVVSATPVARTTPDLFTAPGLGGTQTLEELREHIGDCRRCKLAPHRTNLVFGVGNPKARLVFV